MANVFEGGKEGGDFDHIAGFVLNIPMVSPCGIPVLLESMRKKENGKFTVDMSCGEAHKPGFADEMMNSEQLNMFSLKMLNLIASGGLPAAECDSAEMDGECVFNVTRG